ncbi:MAG: proline--tRNA ligase [Bergeyella sp.]|nr:proline--tRNA ligase [Bergeyella sp.]
MAKLISRKEDYNKWYNELVQKADLAENSGVRGCMVIKPYGFAIWEKMKDELDRKFKETGHTNAYFPIFIPKSLFEAEEKNAEGFAKECAVVTHYRLKNDPGNPQKLIVDPEARLEEELVVRPTSEAIIWNTYKSWIQSYRDLPVLVNQWANVVRWEMRTRFFLRTSEFLWQEGHTAHETREEALEESKKMLEVYADFVENFMAIPVIRGIKSPSERFAGAEETFCIEALMQDGKALQAGTSHFLGQNFSKAFEVKFLNREGKLDHAWGTSWGTSTRLMGALIMTHSDDRGLVLPPSLAPIQVVVVPIFKGEDQREEIEKMGRKIAERLEKKGISAKFDTDKHNKPGWKFAEYELKGIPVRITLGAKEIENKVVEVARRDTLSKEIIPMDTVDAYITTLLDTIQKNIYKKALNYRNARITEVNTYEEFKRVLEEKGGFISAHWDGTEKEEEQIKNETKATIRCIPLEVKSETGISLISKTPSDKRVLFAKAY